MFCFFNSFYLFLLCFTALYILYRPTLIFCMTLNNRPNNDDDDDDAKA